MERGGFGNVVSFARHSWSRARLLAASSRDRSLGGRCRGCGWCGRVGGGRPARVGVLVLDGDGRTFRRVVAQEEAVDAAAARRQGRANLWVSSRRREGRACCCMSLRACRCLSAGAFAGLARVLEPPTCSWSVRACVLCAQCCMCSEMLCSCSFVALGTLGTGSPVGMRDAGPGFACVRAWGRSARRRVLRHSCVRQCRKVVFFFSSDTLPSTP